MDSLPTTSTPRDADDAEVGSREETHQDEEAPEVSQDNLPDFAPDSAPEPIAAPESVNARKATIPTYTRNLAWFRKSSIPSM